MDAFKSMLCCAVPGLLHNRREEYERRTRMERRREKLKQLCRLKVSKDYNTRKDRILSGIEFDYSRTIVIWKQDGHYLFRGDVVQQLHSYCEGEVDFLQDRWTINEEGYRVWYGALVSFKDLKDAEKASQDLPQKIRYVRSTMLESVIDTLIDCELLHPDRPKGESSKVVINRRVPLRVREVDYLHRALNTYGCLQTFFFNNSEQTSVGSNCEVTYPYLTQAYLAMIMTDRHVGDRSIYTSSVERTPRDKQILDDARESIVLLHQSCFPK